MAQPTKQETRYSRVELAINSATAAIFTVFAFVMVGENGDIRYHYATFGVILFLSGVGWWWGGTYILMKLSAEDLKPKSAVKIGYARQHFKKLKATRDSKR